MNRISTGMATLAVVSLLGASTTFTQAGNAPPSVSITRPSSGSMFAAGSSITVAASAFDNDGQVVRIELFNGAARLVEGTSPPYSFTATNVPPGTYVVRAVATDNLGAQTVSSPVTIIVNTPNTPQQFPMIEVPPGLRIEKVVEGLTYPTAIDWDAQGRMYVVEAGGQFLEEPPPSRILLVANGRATEVLNLSSMGVADSVAGFAIDRARDVAYITHRNAADRTGAVSRISRDGRLTELFSGIVDSQSEHQVNDVRIGPDGRVYVASGPAANSGVVGIDNAPFIDRSPNLRTTPCRDYVLTGQNFGTPDFRTADVSDTVQTGAFVPFGFTTAPGQRIPGTNKCGGAILVFDPANPAATLRPFADGFRNVIGLAWNASGEMFAGVNGFDVRGSRPINDRFDATYRVRAGAWYGWPDFSAELLPVTDPQFNVPDSLKAPVFVNGVLQGKPIRFVIDHAASGLTPPDRSLVYGLHEINSSPSQVDVAPASAGALAGQVFVAEWGDLAPQTTPLRDGFAGFQISRIDPATGEAVPFVRNRQRGPASAQGVAGQGIERPYGVRFGPDGAMYIVDYGIARVNPARAAQGQVPYEFPPFTGAIWRVSRVP
ncbi:MAG: sugar dehydrogenase [Acidobacteria bacterium]|nr:sugar dehydrogenase [Acidobacteriota bacterium]